MFLLKAVVSCQLWILEVSWSLVSVQINAGVVFNNFIFFPVQAGFEEIFEFGGAPFEAAGTLGRISSGRPKLFSRNPRILA